MSGGSTKPDIGALEALDSEIIGTLFVDLDSDGTFDREETGLAGVTVYVDLNADGRLDLNEPISISTNDNPSTANNETGQFSFAGLPPGQYSIGFATPPGYTPIGPFRQPIRVVGAVSSAILSRPSISADGTTGVFESTTSVFVPGGPLGQRDIYAFDVTEQRPTLISAGDSGQLRADDSTNPSISDDGKLIAYEFLGDVNYVEVKTKPTTVLTSTIITSASGPSTSGNGKHIAFASSVNQGLAGDSNLASDVFLYTIADKSVRRRISNTSAGIAANGPSDSASISSDGRYVTFISSATNLVMNDLNGKQDVFVYDSVSNKIERISLQSASIESNGKSTSPSISDDGRFVAFVSAATNLIVGENDTNAQEDVFVYERVQKFTRRVSVSEKNVQADGLSGRPDISGDGRHVVFESSATNIVTGDTNGVKDVYVYDLLTNSVARVSTDDSGQQLGFAAFSPSINQDGRFIGYRVSAGEVVVTRNQLEPTLAISSVMAGETSTVNLGITPKPGKIGGTVFEDLILNNAYDLGEPLFEGWKVFLDSNHDGLRNNNETTVISDALGNYTFVGLRSATQYAVAVESPLGLTHVLSTGSSESPYDVVLPSGETITELNFGFRRIIATGQSSAQRSVAG